MTTFAQTAAFPAPIAWALVMAMVVEGTVLHLWLAPSHPSVAWTLTALTASSIVSVLAAQRTVARSPVTLDGDTLAFRTLLGGHVRLDLARDVAAVERLTWRTTPQRASDYFNAGRPGTPTVLLTLQRPTEIAITSGIRRAVTRIALAVDEPDALVASLAKDAPR